MTFSILTRNIFTHEMGLAIASGSDDCYGGSVLADTRYGIISLQGKGDHPLKQKIFAELCHGTAPAHILQNALKHDVMIEQRQIMILPRDGAAAVYTGTSAFKWAGHLSDEHTLIAGNMLATPDVLDAIHKAYYQDRFAHMHRRLLAALKAGINAGGDMRGHHSAAIQVLSQKPYFWQVKNNPDQLLHHMQG